MDQETTHNIQNDPPSHQQTTNPLVASVRDITKVFRVSSQKIIVLKGIDLDVYKGEFLVIWGPSGCGKSTLLHIMMGLEPPTSGTVNLMNNLLTNMTEDEMADFRKSHIGTVFQQHTWIRSANVLENTMFPLLIKGESREIAEKKGHEALKSVEMDDWYSHYPTELSAGQQQKVATVSALSTEPDIIVTDEPTGNLDHKSGTEIMDMLKAHNKKGNTVIMVTHDINNIDYATRVIQMFDGQISHSFTVEQTPLNKIKEELMITKYISPGAFQIQPEKKDSDRQKKSDILLTDRLKDLFIIITKPFFFLALFLLFIFGKTINRIRHLHLFSKGIPRAILDTLYSIYQKIYQQIQTPGNINQFDIINLSIQNLFQRKTRSLVTILGMSVGIGAIVLLVSLGYGFESLVIDQVTTLGELQQLDVRPSFSEELSITDETVSELKSLTGVDLVLPVTSTASNAEFFGSQSDVVVYGVQGDYLKESSILPEIGEIFESNELNSRTITYSSASNEANTESEETPHNQQASIPQQAVVTKKFLEVLSVDPENALGNDVLIEFLPTNTIIDESTDTIPESTIGIETIETEEIRNDSETVIENTSGDGSADSGSAKKHRFEVIGMVSSPESSAIYVPIALTKQQGITDYSHIKLVLNEQIDVEPIRKEIELMGYTTDSPMDTVSEIQKIFSVIRISLAAIGMIALAVAALGMINTLTVSLLERTREVGYMKAMGMKSTQVYNLFISESMIMGILGGITGLLIGYLGGKAITILVSTYTLARGKGFIDVSKIPLSFTLVVILITVIVGMGTGIFPARRAKKISPLDAMRYE